MRILDAIQIPFRWLTERIEIGQRLSRFTCEDCDLHNHCGLPPGENCVPRLEQIAFYGDRPRPRRFLFY